MDSRSLNHENMPQRNRCWGEVFDNEHALKDAFRDYEAAGSLDMDGYLRKSCSQLIMDYVIKKHASTSDFPSSTVLLYVGGSMLGQTNYRLLRTAEYLKGDDLKEMIEQRAGDQSWEILMALDARINQVAQEWKTSISHIFELCGTSVRQAHFSFADILTGADFFCHSIPINAHRMAITTRACYFHSASVAKPARRNYRCLGRPLTQGLVILKSAYALSLYLVTT